MEKQFNEQDSLKLINEMIAQTRNNIQIGAANKMIMSGYFVSAVALLDIVLMNVLENPSHANWVWLLMLLMCVANIVLGKKQDKSSIVRTPVDRIVSYVWIGFMIAAVIALAVIFSSVFIFKTWFPCAFIMPVLLLLTGFGQFITGKATQFVPFLWAAYVFFAGALLSVLLTYYIFKIEEIQFIILIICMIAGFIIPGHILNGKAKENV